MVFGRFPLHPFDNLQNIAMSDTYTGSCLCGGVSIQINSGPIAVFSCFCQHCSKGAGSTNQLVSLNRYSFEIDNRMLINIHQSRSQSFTPKVSWSTRMTAYQFTTSTTPSAERPRKKYSVESVVFHCGRFQPRQRDNSC